MIGNPATGTVLAGALTVAMLASPFPAPADIVVFSPALAAPGHAATWQQYDEELQRGLQLLEAGRADEAIPPLEAAVAERPDSVEARYHLGRALLTAGRAGEAVDHLRVALAGSPEPGPIHFLLAQVYLQLDELEAAAQALAAAAAARPGYPPIDYYAAELCYRLGRVDAARQRFAAVAEATPGWEMPRVRLGMLAIESDRASTAVDWFRAALALNERNPTVWMRLGTALVADGRDEDAEAAYRKATEVGPRFLPAHLALAGQLDSVRDHEGMRAALEEALVLAPEHPLAHYQLASLLSLQGDKEGALAAVDVAIDGFEAQAASAGEQIERHTYRALSRGLRAQILMDLGRTDEAEAQAREVVEASPWYPDAHFVLGTLLVRRGESEGRDLLERFKQLSDAREHREQADAALRANDLERAATSYDLALAADPDDAASLIGLATVRRRQNDPAEALQLLERARPTSAQARDWYQERILALAAEGRAADVEAAWRTARARGLDLGPDVWRVTRADIEGC